MQNANPFEPVQSARIPQTNDSINWLHSAVMVILLSLMNGALTVLWARNELEGSITQPTQLTTKGVVVLFGVSLIFSIIGAGLHTLMFRLLFPSPKNIFQKLFYYVTLSISVLIVGWIGVTGLMILMFSFPLEDTGWVVVSSRSHTQ
jgi:hypothetical protein